MPPHEQGVANVSAAVKAFFSRGQPFRIFHGSTNSTRPIQADRLVDISALSNVLQVDPSRRTATVEPNVSMDKLVQATLAHGMIPPVVMEFPGITVGGGYAGSAGESTATSTKPSTLSK
jgi:Delta24-sterol reductase